MGRLYRAVKGFSAQNIWRIRAFYLAYDVKSVVDVIAGVDGRILPQVVAEIPWGHNILLLIKKIGVRNVNVATLKQKCDEQSQNLLDSFDTWLESESFMLYEVLNFDF